MTLKLIETNEKTTIITNSDFWKIVNLERKVKNLKDENKNLMDKILELSDKENNAKKPKKAKKMVEPHAFLERTPYRQDSKYSIGFFDGVKNWICAGDRDTVIRELRQVTSENPFVMVDKKIKGCFSKARKIKSPLCETLIHFLMIVKNDYYCKDF